MTDPVSRTYDFQGNCLCCGGPTPRIENASAAYLKARVEKRPMRFHCMCGAVMRLRDDGVGTGRGGGIKLTNETPPSISSITPASAGASSGASIRVFGKNFGISAPTVIFGGVASPNVQVLSDTQLNAILPQGSFLVRLSNPSGPIQVGDTLRGQLSNATALVLQSAPLRVGPVTGSFQPGEPVRSNAGVTGTLNSLDGTVDVEIQSAFGRHRAAPTLPGGFSYT